MKPGTIGALTGVAVAHATKRLTRDEALAEMREVLARVPAHDRQRALDESAANYVGPGHWYEDAFAVLVAAGADPDEAARLQAARPKPRGLGGLGEQ